MKGHRAFRIGGARTVAFLLAPLGIGAIALLAHVPQPRDDDGRRRGFEVWLADQSDTRPGFGGQLLIYEGSDLMGETAERAEPIARLDLRAGAADLCRAATGRNPVRPHMIAFNREHTHAVVSFVASGHVVVFDAVQRAALSCVETTVGSTGTRQAHAAFPASRCASGPAERRSAQRHRQHAGPRDHPGPARRRRREAVCGRAADQSASAAWPAA